MTEETPRWLTWAREIFSMSQAGLTYTKDPYDLENYHRLQEIAAEMLASQSELEREPVLASLKMQAGYATPKIDVRGAVFKDGHILLVQERADGKWAIPGGWADVGDAPAAMVEREVREESGLQVKAVKVIAVLDANRLEPLEFYHAYKLLFLCEITGGELQTNHETLNAAFFDPQNLPPLSPARTSAAQVQEALAHTLDPERPALFD